MTIWPVHSRLQEGELLSSWLTRIAAESGMTLPSFCKAVLQLDCRPHQRVIDRAPADALLQIISHGTGVPIERVVESTLLPEEGYLFTQSGLGSRRWIIPTFDPQTASSFYYAGRAYCPECLRNDKKPYYRKLWRYSYYAVCPIHRKFLWNTCPHCSMPYSNTFPFAQKDSDLNNPVTACWNCGGNICDVAPSIQLSGYLLEEILSIQRNILSAVNQGAIEVTGHGYVFSRAYLTALHSVISTMTPGQQFQARIAYVCDQFSHEILKRHVKQSLKFGHHDFDSSDANDRAIFLYLGNWLMGEWPSRFQTYSKKFGIDLHALFQSKEITYWILRTIPSANKPTCTSSEEIANATRLLQQRLKRTVSSYDVQLFMRSGTHIRSANTDMAGRRPHWSSVRNILVTGRAKVNSKKTTGNQND